MRIPTIVVPTWRKAALALVVFFAMAIFSLLRLYVLVAFFNWPFLIIPYRWLATIVELFFIYLLAMLLDALYEKFIVRPVTSSPDTSPASQKAAALETEKANASSKNQN